MYRNAATGAYPVFRSEIIRANPHVSFPAAWGDDVAASLGYDYVTPVAKPKISETQRLVEGAPELVGERWMQVWVIQDLTAGELAERAAALASAEKAARTEALAELDAEAERRRMLVLTPGFGKAREYEAKEAQARALLLDPAPEPNPAAYPFLEAEVGRTAGTIRAVAEVVAGRAEACWAYGAAIAAVAAEAKAAILAADGVEAIQAALAGAAWPEIPE